jgi:hypothetical protein
MSQQPRATIALRARAGEDSGILPPRRADLRHEIIAGSR